ncbi:outer membrane protein [Aestuariivirga sp.]|uniref:outer membrane protein n=1 Tax=Aestuariivirga sp. TaxID=2650926 RepID=UPI003918DD82
MKTITKALLGLALLAGAAGAAQAADAEAYVPSDVVTASGWYLRGDAGWSWLGEDSDDYEGVFVLGGGFGYQFNDNLRADLRGDWAGLGDDDASFSTVLGNVYFDIPTGEMLTPYLGAGLGYGWAEQNDEDEDGIAFGLMAGVGVSLTENLTADVGYRYRQILSEDVHDHQALIGLRYSF